MALCDYEVIVGLEIHAELNTASKLFCACPTSFGAEPNTACCPVCMGRPGALPTLNRQAVEMAVRAGLALGCTVGGISRFDRKQYFYPDLPKAYQISQDQSPLCRDGVLHIPAEGGVRKVRVRRIHLEEDAGKLIHTATRTLIDYNRCGIPLIEIVTEPDLRSAKEAADALRALRGILIACEVSDCKMEEGSLRCDVNLSLRRRGEEGMGTRTEIKNINSFAFTEKAIRYEAERQAELLDHGFAVVPETRRFDPVSGETVLMRRKETADDYRFLPEPNLPPLLIDCETVDRIRESLPELPVHRAARWEEQFGISTGNAEIVVNQGNALADYTEEAMKCTAYPKLAVHFLLTDLLRCRRPGEEIPAVSAPRLGEVSNLFGDGAINSGTAKKLLHRLLAADFDVMNTVEQEHLFVISDEGTLRAVIGDVLFENPRAVADFKAGKRAAANALLGRAMAKTCGLADPLKLERLMDEALTEVRSCTNT